MKETETQFIPKDFDPNKFIAKDFDEHGEEKINEIEKRDHEIYNDIDYTNPPGTKFPKPKRLGVIVMLILTILALMVALGFFRNKDSQIINKPKHAIQINTKAPIFINKASNLGISNDKYTGFFSVTPDGSKLVFSSIDRNNSTIGTYLANLESGSIQTINGNLNSGWINNNLLMLAIDSNTVIHNFETNREFKMDLGGAIKNGSISPNSKLYIMSTQYGISVLDLDNGAINKISNSVYDGAYAWQSDNKHIIGYRDNGTKLPNGENARTLTVWNITDNSFVDLPIQVPIQEIKYVDWIVQNKVIRVNAGYDDNSHDYLINISENKIIDIGDTSGAIINSKTDSNKGLLAMILPVSLNKNNYIDVARIYDSTGNILHEVKFQKPTADYITQRESMHIVDENTLLYIRKSFNTTQQNESKNDLILLDMTTGTENVFRGLNTDLDKVELLANKDTWIVSSPDQFYIGSIKKGIISPNIPEEPIIEDKTTKDNNVSKSIIESPLIKTQTPTKNPNYDLVKQYLNIHLNELSSIKAVLGGKFYVTDLQITNNNSGIVWYEDGHIAARAFFNYNISNNNVSISQFQAEKLLLTGGTPN